MTDTTATVPLVATDITLPAVAWHSAAEPAARANEMRGVSAWLGYLAGLITEDAYLYADSEEATVWWCETPGHYLEHAITDYPDGIWRCRYCQLNDAAIRRAEAGADEIHRLSTEGAQEAAHDMAAARTFDCGPWPAGTAERGQALHQAFDDMVMGRPWVPCPPTPDCIGSGLLIGYDDGIRGSADSARVRSPWADPLLVDYKTTAGWVDPPPTRWQGIRSAVGETLDWLFHARIRLMIVVVILVVSSALNAWIIGHRTTTVVNVLPRAPMVCTPTNPGSAVLNCRPAQQP